MVSSDVSNTYKLESSGNHTDFWFSYTMNKIVDIDYEEQGIKVEPYGGTQHLSVNKLVCIIVPYLRIVKCGNEAVTQVNHKV